MAECDLTLPNRLHAFARIPALDRTSHPRTPNTPARRNTRAFLRPPLGFVSRTMFLDTSAKP